MTTIIPVPSLSVAGWITDPSGKADLLLSHFFESNKSQTYIYGSNVSNLQWLIEQYGHNTNTLTQQINSVLEVYLGRYYDSVSIDTSSDDDSSNTSGDITLTLNCVVVDNGVSYSIGKLIQINDSSILKIISINNG